MKVVISLSLLTCLPMICHGYSTGPPLPACQAMVPNHGIEAQTSPAPYSITTSKDNYDRSDNITVTVTATSASTTPFKGFFIQARNTTSDEAIGQFYLDTDPEIELLFCPAGGSIGNAVAHRTSAEKTTKSFLWNNPWGSDVYFKGTFVHNKTTFWTDVRSAVVHDNEATNGGAKPKYDILFGLLLLFTATVIAF